MLTERHVIMLLPLQREYLKIVTLSYSCFEPMLTERRVIMFLPLQREYIKYIYIYVGIYCPSFSSLITLNEIVGMH